MRACVRACVRVRASVRVRACVRECVRVCACESSAVCANVVVGLFLDVQFVSFFFFFFLFFFIFSSSSFCFIDCDPCFSSFMKWGKQHVKRYIIYKIINLGLRE